MKVPWTFFELQSGHDHIAKSTIFNFKKRAITPKTHNPESRFLCSARRLMLLYICAKFHENISNVFWVTERTWFCDRQTARAKIQVNLLHAEVSYIIHIACHWSSFPMLQVLATFWIAKIPIFFPFSNSQILPNHTRRTYVHQLMFTGLKHAIGLYCGIVWELFYNI